MSEEGSAAPSTFSPRNSLQWSLAPMSEEGVDAERPPRLLVRASMEPRSNERGRRRAARPAGDVPDQASMEPRSNERGREDVAPTAADGAVVL